MSKSTKLAIPVLVAAVALTALPAALPASAFASRVLVAKVTVGTSEEPRLVVDAQGVNQPNRIHIDDDSSCAQFPDSCNTWMVRDLGSPITAVGPHCRQVSANVAICTGAQVGDTRRYQVALGEGNDQLTVNSRYLSGGGEISGGSGDDSFLLPVRATDLITGGPGRDSLSYLQRTAGGGVFVDGVNDSRFNDGQGGEDRVVTDIEMVSGTNFDDIILVPNGFQDVNRTVHGLLAGHNGNDQLFGSPFADTINGGAGFDRLLGGLGNDLLEARESAMAGQTVARDELNCGGGIDTAVMDLQDVRTSDCENVSVAAIDEGGILSIATSRARVRNGRVRVALRCPRSSKTACAGRLTLKRAGRTLGARSYSLRKGARGRFALRVGRVRGRAQATAVEPDSQGRPKTTVKLITLR